MRKAQLPRTRGQRLSCLACRGRFPSAAASQEPPEYDRGRYGPPAEETAHAPAGREHEVVHQAAAVQKERDPQFPREARTVAATSVGGLSGEPAAGAERVPDAAKQDETGPGPVGQLTGAVAKPERGPRALHMGPRWGKCGRASCGCLRLRVHFLAEVPTTEGSGGVWQHPLTSPVPDPGSWRVHVKGAGGVG